MPSFLRSIDFNSIKTRLVIFFTLFGVIPALTLVGVYYSFQTSIEQAYRDRRYNKSAARLVWDGSTVRSAVSLTVCF